jgi:hypothetical protein
MRRGFIALVALSALVPIPAANASHEVTAAFYGVVWPSDDYSTVDVVAACEARAARATTTVSLTCSVDDGAPGTHSNTCPVPGPEAVCYVYVVDGTLPLTLCSSATATLADSTTDTDTRCRTYTAPTS